MASFLIVDDDPLVTRAVARVLLRHGTCRAASSVADATSRIRSGATWDGFVIDVALGDGCGLELLAQLRRILPTTPAVVLSGNVHACIVNRAAVLNARFVCKPFGPSELRPFVSDVLVHASGSRVDAATERARHRWRLSSREAEILNASLRGCSRGEYLDEAAISVNTYKSHVRKLLWKTDYENLSTLAIDLLAEN
jgi:DNA-binding NarL/FixJ family response regulator